MWRSGGCAGQLKDVRQLPEMGRELKTKYQGGACPFRETFAMAENWLLARCRIRIVVKSLPYAHANSPLMDLTVPFVAKLNEKAR
jgi:hypothetical protein